MARFNFCGGCYQSEGLGFDCQRALNVAPEIHELGDGTSKMCLLNIPGLKSFANLDGIPRGQFEFNGRLFVAGSHNFYEITATLDSFGALVSVTATVLNSGVPLVNDLRPVSITANEIQILIASGGSVYVYYLSAFTDSQPPDGTTPVTVPAGTFALVDPSNFTLPSGNAPVVQVEFCDSFFLALIANSQTVQISNLLNGARWDLNGQIIVSVYPDNITTMKVDHRELWLQGRKATAIYVATGSLNVFDIVTGGYIQQGSEATFGTTQLDNTLFWLGRDGNGSLVGYRAQGYLPIRISTHPIELAWQSYPKASDAVSYAYQERGHTYWVVYFPSANNFRGATWVYDVASTLWHERDDQRNGLSYAHPSWNHAFCFGAHFVGDWNTNKLYVMSKKYLNNDGNPLIKQRTAPHIFTEQERIDHNRFELACEMGIGWPNGDQAHTIGGATRPPTVFLDWSNDGGHTWTSAQGRSFGFLGETRLPRPVWRRLGQARMRTYRVTCSEDLPVKWFDAYVNATPGYTPTERLPHQIRKSA